MGLIHRITGIGKHGDNMKVFYCIPTYKSFEECKANVESAMRGSRKPDQIVIIDNSPDMSGTSALQPLTAKYKNVFIWPQGRNIGVAASWNLFHRSLDKDYVVIANDDIQLHEHTLETIIQTATALPSPALVCGAGESGNAFSLFMLKHLVFETIGPFDEHFYPAYYEDNDYVRRLTLAGLSLTSAPNATYDHVGSSTLKKFTQPEMDLHHHSFRRNTQYYEAKWGGLPGKEIYTEPFSGDI